MRSDGVAWLISCSTSGARCRGSPPGSTSATTATLPLPVPFSRPASRFDHPPIPARTDVYALGVILYELLCGRPPYVGSFGYLVRTGEYSARWDWVFLVAAVTIAVLSEKRQRRAFYDAGLLNTGAALYLIAAHRDWFDKPLWAVLVIAAGLLTLAAGFALDRRQRLRR